MLGGGGGVGEEVAAEEELCCVSHGFFRSASRNPSSVAVVHAAAADSGERRAPPRRLSYPGDCCFTSADLLSSVAALSRRIRAVLDGGSDPDLGPSRGSSTAEPMMSALSADENGSNTETDRMPQIVGVYSDPSVEYIVAVLSILRCGEAFLPLDPSWPEERILSIVTSSNAALIINCRPLWRLEGTGRLNAADWLVERCSCSIMQFDMKPGLGKQFDQPDLAWPCENKRQRKFCYLMYTSGSTGKPKGVCGTERGLLNRFSWMQGLITLCAEDVLLFKTSISFIDHLQEFLSAILTGTILIIPPFEEVKANAEIIVRLIKAYGISRLTAVPSLIRIFLPFLERSSFNPLKVLILSGEILSISLWSRLHEILPDTTILNLYGSTEVSGDCTFFDCRNLPSILAVEPLSSVPIGIPISNCDVVLVGEADDHDEGEIYVGGACLFAGYFTELLKRKSMMENANTLFFKTGDFARRLSSGELVFVERKDRLIKINGQRVALDEIEENLREHPEVSDAAVTFHESSGKFPHLIAYLVLKINEETDEEHKEYKDLMTSIRSWLVRKLPPVMIPSYYFRIQSLPVSFSGKIDYARLSSSEYMPMQHTIEFQSNSADDHLQIIKKVFSNILLVEKVSDHDDFFAMGGNSLSAAQAAYKLGIDMRLLYTYPSPFKLLNAILDRNDRLNSPFNNDQRSAKRLKVCDSILNSTGEKSLQIIAPCNADKAMNHWEENAKSPSTSSLDVDPSLPLASDETNFRSHDQWVLNFDLPKMCAFSRCNQFLHGSEHTIEGVNRTCLSFEIPRNRKGALQELWNVLLKSCVDASPLAVFVDGKMTIFIGSHSHIFLCIDASSGSIRWEITLGGRIEGSAAITGDFSQVVVGCYDGKIYFLEFMTGNISWTFQTDGEVKMQPVVDRRRDIIWCGSHDHHLYALNYKEHCCVYKVCCGGSIYGSPAIDMVHNIIYAASTSGRVTAISLKVPPFSVIWSYEAGAPIFGSLSTDSLGQNVICCLVDGHVMMLNPRGAVVWKANVGGPIFAGPCVSSTLAPQVLVCSRNGSVYSFDTEGICFGNMRLETQSAPLLSSTSKFK
ncbi:putative acyl-activating enzyme 19 isoform X2 [Ananas comosus]|uniref:4-coumarate--CoA ligase n=1 Tax=Ananas comosus TaxID=4615 RepID=A0A6P5H5H6_ANACO|nr:putative acyl-activating enzyme 19 isoform X2 [Ananas comosus]